MTLDSGRKSTNQIIPSRITSLFQMHNVPKRDCQGILEDFRSDSFHIFSDLSPGSIPYTPHRSIYRPKFFLNSRERVHTSLIFRLHKTGAKLSCRSSISLSGGSRLAFPDGLWRWKRWQSDILTCMHGLHAWKWKEKKKRQEGKVKRSLI